jgi:DNA-binding IclR family transcriptional regulator
MTSESTEADAAISAEEMDVDEPDDGSLVKAVQRALRIIGLFDARHPEWSPSELGRRSGLRRTTAYRLMKTLEAEGVITLCEQTGKYSLGPAVFQLAYVWISQAGLARIATPHLERLTTVTGETSNLMVWNGEGVLCVAHSPSPRPFKLMMSVGQTFTDLANAESKVLLAFGPENRRTECLKRRLEPLTPFTITDPDRFAGELRRVAQEGVAYDIQEQQLGVCAVSVPVWDFSDEVRASMSVVVSESRYGPAEAKRYGQVLKQVAAALSYDLGYRGERMPLP